MKSKKENPHPGSILKDRFLTPLKLSGYALHKATGLQEMTIHRLLHGKVGITAETALRLARFTNTTPEYWMNLQLLHDLQKTKQEKGSQIEAEIQPLAV